VIPLAVEALDLHLEIDDPCGSISTHLMTGLWGLVAVGLFGIGNAGFPGQALAQIVGIATLVGFVLPLAWGLNALLNIAMKMRVPAESEYQGMDLSELGAGAYPEFMTHSDDFMQR
jgi:Amt family ammonium transporter